MGPPEPIPGLIIGYSYLWADEAEGGQDEGRKDRPCVIVVAVQRRSGATVVTVAPVTHTPPRNPETAIEIPAFTKARVGLDDQPSWIVASDLNSFAWPGLDLRRSAQGGRDYVYGFLPKGLFAKVRAKVLTLADRGLVSITSREN